MGVEEDALEVASTVGSVVGEDATTGVPVSVGGAVVGEG